MGAMRADEPTSVLVRVDGCHEYDVIDMDEYNVIKMRVVGGAVTDL